MASPYRKCTFCGISDYPTVFHRRRYERRAWTWHPHANVTACPNCRTKGQEAERVAVRKVYAEQFAGTATVAAEPEAAYGQPPPPRSHRDQYSSIKAHHPDAVLLFRDGDRYVAFGADADSCFQHLGLVHTDVDALGALAWFPAHALEDYLPRLVRAGFRVAIADPGHTAPSASLVQEPQADPPLRCTHRIRIRGYAEAMAMHKDGDRFFALDGTWHIGIADRRIRQVVRVAPDEQPTPQLYGHEADTSFAFEPEPPAITRLTGRPVKGVQLIPPPEFDRASGDVAWPVLAQPAFLFLGERFYLIRDHRFNQHHPRQWTVVHSCGLTLSTYTDRDRDKVLQNAIDTVISVVQKHGEAFFRQKLNEGRERHRRAAHRLPEPASAGEQLCPSVSISGSSQQAPQPEAHSPAPSAPLRESAPGASASEHPCPSVSIRGSSQDAPQPEAHSPAPSAPLRESAPGASASEQPPAGRPQPAAHSITHRKALLDQLGRILRLDLWAYVDKIVLATTGEIILDIIQLDRALGHRDREYDPVHCTYNGLPSSMRDYVRQRFGQAAVDLFTDLLTEKTAA